MATATGKSLVIAWLIRDLMRRCLDLRVLAITHVQELIKQNVDHVLALWPDAPLGINCAALGRRDLDHPVPHDGDGMYRSLLDGLHQLERIAGFTATPFRLDSGRLDEGDRKIFDDVVFNYGIGEGIRDGWLSPLSSKATDTQIDVTNVGRRGGEFIESELQEVANVDAVVRGACSEIVKHGADRRCWLVFCAGVDHAGHVRDVLRAHGVTAEAVLGETPTHEREEIIAAYKAGEIRCLVNVNVLTTGFNVPQVDMLAMLRPTLSTGLYVQMVGRGTRKAEGKTNCLVLDFAGNVYRHGPVDSVDPKSKSVAVKPGDVRAKACPSCDELVPLNTSECSVCGYQWPRPAPKPKHATVADAVPVLSTGQSWVEVTSTSFRIHYKRSDPLAPPSLCVGYLCGLTVYSEYISLQRDGYARARAEKWWFAMGGEAPAPATVAEALGRRDEIGLPFEIAVYRNGQYWNVADRRLRRDDGAVVEVDRNFNIWVSKSREAAFEAMRREPINDEIVY
jgi:DNA repair protein RadD